MDIRDRIGEGGRTTNQEAQLDLSKSQRHKRAAHTTMSSSDAQVHILVAVGPATSMTETFLLHLAMMLCRINWYFVLLLFSLQLDCCSLFRFYDSGNDVSQKLQLLCLSCHRQSLLLLVNKPSRHIPYSPALDSDGSINPIIIMMIVESSIVLGCGQSNDKIS